jgi:linoleoyl-CoA desaturase
VRTSLKIKFAPTETDDAFGKELRDRINHYFLKNNLSKKFNSLMLLKSFIYLALFFSIYGSILLGGFSYGTTIILWMFLGALTAGIGFNIGHDANHGAYSSSEWINRFMGASFLLLGADMYCWKVLHNTIHHSYTNIFEADGDLHPVSILRFDRRSSKLKIHRFQYLYAPLLYSFTSLIWVFRKDFQQIRRKKHLIFDIPAASRLQIFTLIFFKSIYYFAFLVLPLIILNHSWWQVLTGFLAMHFVAGFCLAIVFQLGHLVEGPDFPQLDPENTILGSWWTHQLSTASNFSTQSRIAEWLFGGLNFQIEHHLFPKICHIHYRALSPIVKSTALEYGLPYHERPHFFSAFKSHITILKKLGTSD